MSLGTSFVDVETPARGEAAAPPFQSFSRRVPAQARDALESLASPAAALRPFSCRNFANLAVLPDDHRQTESSKLDAFFAGRAAVGTERDAGPLGHFLFWNRFQPIV